MKGFKSIFALFALLACVFLGYQHGAATGVLSFVCMATGLANFGQPLHVLGANSFDPAFVTDIARNQAITVLQNKLAALGLYSTRFTTDPMAPKKNILTPLVTGTDSVQVNPTNFETGGDTTSTKISVTVDHLFKNFHITFAELQQGYSLETLLAIQLATLANKIVDVAKAPLTTANGYALACPAVAAADFGTDDLKLIYAAAKNFDFKGLVLDGSYLAQFIPTDKFQFALGEAGAYGFDRMAMCNRWTGADTNVVGTVGSAAGLAVASGMPVIHNAIADKMLISEQITIPNLGITVMFNVWGSLSNRTVYGSYELMFGAAKGDTSTMKLIKSA